MRLRVEFTTEPFEMEAAPGHALAARDVVADLDNVDIGPFGNTAEGEAGQVLSVVDALYRTSLRAGASRITVQLSVVDDSPGEGAAGEESPAHDEGSVPDEGSAHGEPPTDGDVR